MPDKQILIADDSETVRKHLSTILTRAGYQVSEATNGLEALEKVKDGRYDLLVLDLQMPRMNGFEVLRIVKSGGVVPNLPVLCITGVHKDLADIHKLKELGASGYVSKECTPEDLLFRVEKALKP